ncbi:uncharacterized protein [Acropora muricata]|uniref:uncharacterized protein n=1 Tax=Acropora muricata TaxID=159855 RepID=UPI0034E61320
MQPSMRLWKRPINITFLIAAISVAFPVSYSRSVGTVKSHKIKKRSLYEETCPPPYVIEVTEKCKDTCLDDDYCVGNQMCCFDGCSYVCMDPVPSEAVVDWIDDKSESFQENVGNAELEVVTPVIEELGCYYRGMILTDGERIPLGCKLCTCFNGNLMCDVANCNKEYQARLAKEISGSGSGDEENDDDDDDDDDDEGSGNDKRYPIISSVEHKEEFVPFKEFAPFTSGDNKIEQSGGEEKSNPSNSKDVFIPFDEETKAENSGYYGDNEIEQSGVEEERSSASNSKDIFIPFDEETNAENSGDYSDNEIKQSGEEEKSKASNNKDILTPFDEETDAENSGGYAASLAKRLK